MQDCCFKNRDSRHWCTDSFATMAARSKNESCEPAGRIIVQIDSIFCWCKLDRFSMLHVDHHFHVTVCSFSSLDACVLLRLLNLIGDSMAEEAGCASFVKPCSLGKCLSQLALQVPSSESYPVLKIGTKAAWADEWTFDYVKPARDATWLECRSQSISKRVNTGMILERDQAGSFWSCV